MRAQAPLGDLVAVHGRRLWTHRSGTGGPAVVVLPGAGGMGLDHLLVHERVARSTTSVLYDRAGTGFSEDADLPRPADEVTDELYDLLRLLGVLGPYVLVGHSLGGLYARRFAQRHPVHVAGLVLLDPAHEDHDAHQPEHLRLATTLAGATEPELTPELYALGRAQAEAVLAPLPATVRGPLIAQHLHRLAVGFREGGRVLDDLDVLRAGGPVPRVPLAVLTATGVDTTFAPAEVLREQVAGTARLGAAIAAAGDGEHRTVPDAAHTTLPTARPDAVADAVQHVVGLAAAGRRALLRRRR